MYCIMKIMKLFFTLCLLAFVHVVVSADYCAPKFSKARNVGYISEATTAGATTDLNYVPATIREYKNMVVGDQIVAFPGEEVALSLKTVDARWGVIYIYADLNGDSEFDVTTELIGKFGDTTKATNETDLATVNTSFTIPANAPKGVTHMRIIFADGDTPAAGTGPCAQYIDGGYYDFEINIQKKVEYCVPTFTKARTVGYITEATTTAATVNLNYIPEEVKSYKNAVVGNQIIAASGQEVALSLKTVDARWGVIYIYVDLNSDSEFDATTELIGKFGDTSKSTNGDDLLSVNTSFTIPANTPKGMTRMRIIFADGDTPVAGTGPCSQYVDGGYYDFELNIQDVVVEHAVNFTSPVAGGTFVVKNGEAEVTSGTSLPESTLLTVITTPDTGYELDAIKVNGTTITGNTFRLESASTILVSFKEIVQGSAIRIPAYTGTTRYQFRFDDALLGTHTHDKSTNDNRARNLTVSAWVKPLTASTSEVFGHMQTAFYAAQGSFAVFIKAGNLGIRSRSYTTGTTCPGQTDVETSVSLPTTEWSFITLSIDNTGKKIRLYKNGTQIAETAIANNGIGMLFDESVFFCGNNGFTGDIDEYQVWNKTLTEAEISESMAGYSSAPENLIYYYNFTSPDASWNFANKGTGGTCNAALYKGTFNSGTYAFGSRSVPEPTFVEGHVLSEYTLTYQGNVTGGTVEIQKGGVKVESGTKLFEGTTLTVVTTPQEGYQLKTIQVNGKTITGNTFSLVDNSEVIVEFTNKKLVNFTAGEGGSIAVSENGTNPLTNGGEFTSGSSITITLTVETGYEVSAFTVNGADKKADLLNNQYTIANCTENLDVDVLFAKQKFAVTHSAGANGTLVVKNGTTTVNTGDLIEYGTQLTISLTPANAETSVETFTINGVDKKSELSGNALVVTVTGAMNIAATFKTVSYSLTYNTSDHGTITVTCDDVVVPNGGQIQKNTYLLMKLTPNTNCTFVSLKVNTVDVTGDVDPDGYEYWVEVSSDVVVEAIFASNSAMSGVNMEIASVYYNSQVKTLNFSGMKDEIAISVCDITGKKVLAGMLAGETFDVSSLSNGCYILILEAQQGRQTVKFVKN